MALLAVVTAAGKSRRMGGTNKLLISLGGIPLLLHSMRTLHSFDLLTRMVVSAAEGDEEEYRGLFAQAGLAKVACVVTGGAERQESIGRALEALAARGAGPQDVVAIHDAARPFLSHEMLHRLVHGLGDLDGVLPMVAVKDTIKIVQAGRVARTLPRQELFAAQTPQLFPFQTILEAHRSAARAGFLGTDDCSLIEWRGGCVGVVEGDYRNLKVTTPEDLAVAERLLTEIAGV
ncbi:2-C-methyl-D-erythritol 4-phosphate cytidylyltransferase [bacterium CPR1]|nr:2-C-methyl-D-erythritol 4-phosphate cytidylyltransferase [bacterium CPR1]